MRMAMGIEYDGSGFRGWQSQQAGTRTVQDCLERAIARVANHAVRVVCAGRTDAGVHATGQVVHFDTPARRRRRNWLLGVNSNLPEDINLTWVREAPDTFHARFSALARRYRYVILNRPFRSALERRRAVWCHRPLDADTMQAAGLSLVGEHDFSSFRAVECQAKSPVRRIHELTVRRLGEQVILEVEANAFLHHMVRNIAGVLMTIGGGERPVDWVDQVLAYRDRTLGGVTAPAQGLYLTTVRYDPAFDLEPPGIWERF